MRRASRIVASTRASRRCAELEADRAGERDTMVSASHREQPAVVEYLSDAHSVVKVFDLKGKPVRDIAVAGHRFVGGFGGKRGDSETFYSFTSFTTPTTIYRLDLKANEQRVPPAEGGLRSGAYETRQQFFTSRDGTKVPMFIVSKKGLKLDGNNPTYLYGYGGFNISLTPAFSPANLAWMEMGGVYVVANLRGGGEYGESWHGRHQAAKAERVRRLHRRGRVADRAQGDVASQAGDRRRQQRRPAGGRGNDPASGVVRRQRSRRWA
jgi:prolyl oligopeptidase PreP (S9A serine peptidase family)